MERSVVFTDCVEQKSFTKPFKFTSGTFFNNYVFLVWELSAVELWIDEPDAISGVNKTQKILFIHKTKNCLVFVDN